MVIMKTPVQRNAAIQRMKDPKDELNGLQRQVSHG